MLRQLQCPLDESQLFAFLHFHHGKEIFHEPNNNVDVWRTTLGRNTALQDQHTLVVGGMGTSKHSVDISEGVPLANLDILELRVSFGNLLEEWVSVS